MFKCFSDILHFYVILDMILKIIKNVAMKAYNIYKVFILIV
jgi:hypothetical protein